MIAVVVIFSIPAALIFVFIVAMVVFAIIDREPGVLLFAVMGLVVGLFPGMVAHGLWRGYRGSRTWALVVGVLSVPLGIAILLLMTTRPAKEWFGLPTSTDVRFPQSD
ncbi:hypothetical protein DMH08_30015 [Actinomadura sp. WAC 06369]|nr:hypothetical protein DMH08_30015 [Actinomadura sp. WAC 06369]